MKRLYLLMLSLLMCLGVLGVHLQDHPPVQAAQPASPPLMSLANYPLQPIDPAHYQPTGDWVGRLILPEQHQDEDWVWFEVQHAPPDHPDLLGQTVRLAWMTPPTPITTVDLSPEAKASLAAGLIHPVRLDGRRVGPLQSLAGARRQDDVLVTLASDTQVNRNSDQPQLKITTIPVQVPGRSYALVKLEIPTRPTDREARPERFLVQYYNATTETFEASADKIWIPQAPPNHRGVLPFTIKQLEQSPVGQAGWYVYGAHDAEGVFVVRAIAPRQLFQLQPDQVVLGPQAGLNYINHRNWEDTPTHKGTSRSVLIDPNLPDPRAALKQWQVGDRALVLHLFGGIGGRQAEPDGVIATVTGHFAYGTAEVIQEPLSQALQFNMQYEQVYAHNPEGIIAGSTQWAEYMGHLQRGWAGTRPVSDILVKFPPLTEDYQFGDIQLSPWTELVDQLQLMAARYRTGDGTGASLVTPAKSCVQDSSQAVYNAIEQIKQQVAAQPQIQTWLQQHPQDEQTLRFQQLVALGDRMTQELAPLGIVRSDWKQNAEMVTGIRGEFAADDSLIAQLLSWRTVMPRVACDRITRLFLNLNAPLWILRTDQIGGQNPNIVPLAPTELLGRWPIVPRIFSRLLDAVTTLPNLWEWLMSLMISLIYCIVALGLGIWQGFIQWSPLNQPFAFKPHGQLGLGSFIAPALIEELLFRGLLLPHPNEGVLPLTTWIWMGISLGLFILYHPLNALTAYRHGQPTFFQPIFLILAAGLGITCTALYLLTGSIWPAVCCHWIVVAVWLLLLGGAQRLRLL